MDLIKISQLDELNRIVNNDFFPLVDSGSHTTVQSTLDTFAYWVSTNVTASHALNASSADYAISASYAISCSWTQTASYLLYQGFPNGTASYALNVPYADSASYVDTSNFTAIFASSSLSASWASSSISASYISASNIEGIPFTSSHATTASYAITASNAITSSYAITSSNALTSSHVFFAKNCATGTQFSVFGPFFADPNSTLFVYWGQYDYQKRAVAFILEDTSDIVVKCLVNYENLGDVNSWDTSWYIGVQLLAEGLSTPIAAGTHNNEFNAISIETSRGESGNIVTAANTTELIFRVNSLAKGQYRVYVLPCVSYRHMRVLEYAISASNADIPDYNLFLADQNGFSPQLPNVRIPKFANSVQVLVYSNKLVRQGVYSTTVIPGPDDPPVSPTPTWKRWSLTYAVNGNTISDGHFEWNFLYTSALVTGEGEANWWGEKGYIDQQRTVYLCLPTDYVLTSTTNGPTGRIIRGPTVTTTGCTP